MNYSLSEKFNYYDNRRFDKKLTPGQRDYASKKVLELSKELKRSSIKTVVPSKNGFKLFGGSVVDASKGVYDDVSKEHGGNVHKFKKVIKASKKDAVNIYGNSSLSSAMSVKAADIISELDYRINYFESSQARKFSKSRQVKLDQLEKQKKAIKNHIYSNHLSTTDYILVY